MIEEIIMTPQGIALTVYLLWVMQKNPKAQRSLKAYCNYLKTKGYGENAFTDITAMSQNEGCDWINETFERYVDDPDYVAQMIVNV